MKPSKLFNEYMLIILFMGLGMSVAAYSMYAEKQLAKPHTPKFSYGQCFAKIGLREPWDTEVEGRVYSRGYLKYLVMYKSEAERTTLAPKASWEEDIVEFDRKHKVVPCPESWKKHTHTGEVILP